MQVACAFGRDDIAKLLLSKGAKLDPFEAAALGKTSELAAMIQANPSLLRKTDADVLLAGMKQRDETVQMLVHFGVVPNVFEASAAGLDERLSTLVSNKPRLAANPWE